MGFGGEDGLRLTRALALLRHYDATVRLTARLLLSGKGGGKGGGKGKGGKGKGFGYSEGPPESVVEMGTFMHACEGDMVIKSTNEKVRPACGTSPARATKGRVQSKPQAHRALWNRFRLCGCVEKREREHSEHAHSRAARPRLVQVPYFNAPIYLENKSDVGKVRVWRLVRGVRLKPKRRAEWSASSAAASGA